MSETPQIEKVIALLVTKPLLFDNFRNRQTSWQKFYAVLRTIKRAVSRNGLLRSRT
jgi:hypothetical protein